MSETSWKASIGGFVRWLRFGIHAALDEARRDFGRETTIIFRESPNSTDSVCDRSIRQQ